MARLSVLQLGKVLLRPSEVFAEIAARPPSSSGVFFGFALWLGLAPPVFAYVGTMAFGWRLGVEPLFLTAPTAAAIAAAYFALLLVGFLSAGFVAHWMASTYSADASFGRSFALIALVGAPLTVGSVVHLFPHALINVLVLVPMLIWSMYLLYRGLPIVLKTDPAHGMLMASSLVAYLLVAWVTLLGITVVLWSHGIGPRVLT
ncbi:MAG TPA: Yip1 family protein [Gammaproteobacteria bacterium]|nr:Yip1 family protein [Gammaproteobacteria bacterium]